MTTEFQNQTGTIWKSGEMLVQEFPQCVTIQLSVVDTIVLVGCYGFFYITISSEVYFHSLLEDLGLTKTHCCNYLCSLNCSRHIQTHSHTQKQQSQMVSSVSLLCRSHSLYIF